MLNLRWTIADMDAIAALVRKGWKPDDLAYKYKMTEKEMVALLRRNGMPVHRRRVWTV